MTFSIDGEGELQADYPPQIDETRARTVALVYQQLRALARRYMRGERQDHTLQATALVHETYLQLVRQHRLDWQNEAQFLGVAARLMRRTLLEHARTRRALKRGGQMSRLALDEVLEVAFPEPGVDLLALDEALEALAAIQPLQGRVVELRYFAGLSIDETARVLALSPATIKRHWTLAKGWLRLYLDGQCHVP